MVHYAAPPVTGGVESVLGAHARLLRRAGHDVLVIAGRGEAMVIPEIDSRHPDVERVTEGLARGDGDPVLFERLRSTISDRLRQPLADRELTIVHNVLTMPLNLPLTAALLELTAPAGPAPAPAPVRLLAWTHDLAATNPRYGGFRRPGHPYTLIATAQPRVRYVAVSAARAAEVANALGLTPAQVPVVPNGIDPAAFLDIGESTRDLGRRAGFAGADPLVLVPARVTRRKRLELAIAAAAQLRRRHPRLRVVVTGALGPHTADNRAYQCELAALRDGAGLQDVVVFCHEHGAGDDNAHPVDGAMMAELYRLADVVLLTSESEGFGLPVLEAALARVPIVCPDIPILREVGGDGLIAFPADGGPGQVAAAVDLALDLPGPRLRSRVLRANDWDRVRRQLEDQIEAALA